MGEPPLLMLGSAAAYRQHFEHVYCRGPTATHDGFPVWFRRADFSNAFFESSQRNQVKDVFSVTRAERMDWIKATLQAPFAARYCGWDAKSKCYDPVTCVSNAYDDYVVVVCFRRRRAGEVHGWFKTAYVADNSIGKIRSSPIWSPP